MLRASDLQGFDIPKYRERILTTLFADDTTVFLCASDSYPTLVAILDKWCLASWARFNKHKTEMIPIGSPAYRATLFQTRCLNPNDPAIPASVNIAINGEAIRILGAFIGNNANTAAPWAAVSAKVQQKLDQWGRSHPSLLRGKPLVVQMIIGGCTQYLARVQGMPPITVKAMNGMARRFLWGDAGARFPPVSLQKLMLPVESGGSASST
ncbi:hypothetical protein OF83DRAFT_1165835 [Amylostereum chailletii]|nr:hypothetical protein OF83DRAFT_1165835 [Amylostereum chailletii]